MKIKPMQKIVFKDKDEAILFYSINRDCKFYNGPFTKERVRRPEMAEAAIMWDNGDIMYILPGLEGACCKDFETYTLPNCGVIPYGWRLVEDCNEKPDARAKVWNKYSINPTWMLRDVHTGKEYCQHLYYIVPEEPAAEEPISSDGFVQGAYAIVANASNDHHFPKGIFVVIEQIDGDRVIARGSGNYVFTQSLLRQDLKIVFAPADKTCTKDPIGTCVGTTQEGELVYLKSPSPVFTSTIKEEEKMLSPQEKQDIAAIIAEQLGKKSSSNGLASKSLSLAGGATKSLAKWAIAPAKPLGWLVMKSTQYALFMALVGSIGAGGYWAWQKGGSLVPSIKWEDKSDKSPSDKTVSSEEEETAAKLTSFISTGNINI